MRQVNTIIAKRNTVNKFKMYSIHATIYKIESDAVYSSVVFSILYYAWYQFYTT